MQNLISLNIPTEDFSEIQNALNVLNEKLVPCLRSLTPDDRREISKMGDKTVAFVQKSLEYCTKNPSITPGYLDVEEFRKDVESVSMLREISQPLEQILQLVNDTMMMAGSDAYVAALVFYNAAKGATKQNLSGAEPIYNDLSSRFVGNFRKSFS